MEPYELQRSSEWLAHRRNKVTATNANVIMGYGFGLSIYDIWLDKLGMGKEIEVNERMQRGLTLEPIAREWAEKELGLKFDPTVRNHRTIEYMMASSDGWHAESNTLIEIKTSDKLHDEVKPYYYPQLQHLIETFEVDKILYVSFDGISGRIIEVKRDDEYIDKLLEEEEKFWHCVTSFTEPELSEKDYVKRDDLIYTEKLMIYLNNKKNMEQWKELTEKSRKELIQMTEGPTQCMGCKISETVRSGNIDYKKFLNENQLNEKAEKYRKEPIRFWNIRE